VITVVDRLLGNTESSARIAWRTMAGDIAATGPLRFAATVIGGLALALALYVALPS
jgi:hypothetical protein